MELLLVKQETRVVVGERVGVNETASVLGQRDRNCKAIPDGAPFHLP